MFTLGFAALALALAFWQMPGTASSDTKIDLHVDPGRFLSDVASVWTPSSGLGEVQSAQYGGYLWPMAPFFALLHGIGLSSWVVQRLWLAAVLALAGWGMLRLLDQLVGRPRGIVHLVATAFWVVNPYTTVFTARTTITLLGYAALPWLLLCVQQGVRRRQGWRAWWWPAAFALIFMSTGGGVNAAVVFYMAIGPVLLMLYEPAVGHARWRDAGGFFLRAVLLSTLASLWWISALLVHVQYGIDFLQYTEQPRTIWGTNAITESLRLMGYWTSYLGAGYPRTAFPYFSDGSTLLYNIAEVGASLLLPALSILGFSVGATAPVRALLRADGRRRGRGDVGRLPRRDTAAGDDELDLLQRVRQPVPAHGGQGGAAGGVRAGLPARRAGAGRLGAAAARLAVGARRGGSPSSPARRCSPRSSRWPPCPCSRAGRSTGRSPGSRSRPRGARPARTSTGRWLPTPARSCCRARSSAITAGAARSIRSSPG